ncbi:S8 family serine peptidase [Pontibacter sp. JAM-7]|uniref:S8 family serine peptidase n=1 Tax=Pontibacter sp. JAM-7 TaxID=3366581 RepID=UPI003AF62518
MNLRNACFGLGLLYFPSVVLADAWLDQLNIPRLDQPKPDKPLVIAVVDDAFRLSHQQFKDIIWQRPDEIADNGIDDDGNGYIDDRFGWDIADNDNSVLPPLERLPEFYHGTHLSGIIASIVKRAYGDQAGDYVRILPIKGLSDHAPIPYLKDAYSGLEYALDSGADLVLAAWAETNIAPRQEALLKRAEQQGTIIVAAAGNFQLHRPQYPAAFPSVLSVTAAEANGTLTEHANYGQHVNLVAPGTAVISAGSTGDDHTYISSGSSQASAMAVAAVALLKLAYPDLNPAELKACLIEGADAFPELDARWVAQLGAGTINVQQALACPVLKGHSRSYTQHKAYQGYLNLANKAEQGSTWVIRPPGQYQGLRFLLASPVANNSQGQLSIYSNNVRDAAPDKVYALNDLPDQFYIPGGFARLVVQGGAEGQAGAKPLLFYRAEPIDYSSAYCKGTVYVQKAGVLDDGSGAARYAYNSNCKWQITAPAGKRIQLRAIQLDTEKGVDKLYFFNGTTTEQRNMMAIFSGTELPPAFTSWSNNVLLWFASDGKQQGQGWQISYQFID